MGCKSKGETALTDGIPANIKNVDVFGAPIYHKVGHGALHKCKQVFKYAVTC